MQLKLLGWSGRTDWLSPVVTVQQLGGITPSIVSHHGVLYLMSGGGGDLIYYRQMNPLVTSSVRDVPGNWPEPSLDAATLETVRRRLGRVLSACADAALEKSDTDALAIMDCRKIVKSTISDMLSKIPS